mmetsp:Transcript_17845/g.21865  ORF Transcript_17845/g.21865 Transcript_17845/m.21865 type:complete len:668 (+) Transcript_17845:38-2041(+)
MMLRKEKSRSGIILVILATLFVCIARIGFTKNSSSVGRTWEEFGISLFSSTKFEMEKKLDLSCSNKYGKSSGKSGPGSDYPYFKNRLIAEPFRETEFQIDNDDDLSIDQISWTLYKVGSSNVRKKIDTSFENSLVVSNNKLIWTPTDAGDYEIEVSVKLLNDDHIYVFAKTVAVRYVRREIRDLTEDDRDLFFDSYITTTNINTEGGRKLYGDTYRNLQYFLELHLNLAGNKLTDQLHDGLGFATQHSAITAAFEENLQLIEPSTTIPYWDYTIDHHIAAKTIDPIYTLWHQDLWSDDYFGLAQGPFHTIETGRFAYTTIAQNHSARVRSPYGFLRAPWNCNKSPFLTRCHSFCGANYEWGSSDLITSGTSISWPSCKSHYELTFEIDSLYDWIWDAGYNPHGPVHFMIGGYTHCGDLYEKMPALDPKHLERDGSMPTPEEMQNRSLLLGIIKEMALIFPKTMWRKDMVEYPETCSNDTPQSMCHMICDKNVSNTAFREWVVGDASSSKLFGDWISDLPDELLGQFLESICTTPWTPGEQLEAASPADISFWPIHPTMERLLTWKRIIQPFKSASWTNPTDAKSTKYCIYEGSSDCRGHHPWDLTHFPARLLDQETKSFDKDRVYLTNGEFFDAVDPYDYKVNWIYDSFSWQHCAEDGYYFGSAAPS